MFLKNSINNIVEKLHLKDFIDSHRRLLKDNRGGFLIPVEVKIKDLEYKRYRHLPINWSISPITKDDLPEEFSENAVKTVDMFRRKTHDLDCECLIYFDIHTGNIVFCGFSDDDSPYKVEGDIYVDLLKNRHIASAHNHPIQYGSPPSGKNFQMLSLEFEEYELVLSKNELWILESRKEIFEDILVNEIRQKLGKYLNATFDSSNDEFDEGFLVLDNVNKKYGDFLLIYLNNKLKNIKLSRRYFND